MKKSVLALTLLINSAFAADFECISKKDAYAYYGESVVWELQFSLTPKMTLMKNASMKTSANSMLGFNYIPSIKREKTFIARNPRYTDHVKFVAEDPWCNYSMILPPDATQSEKFVGMVYSVCEEGAGGTFSIYCRLQ